MDISAGVLRRPRAFTLAALILLPVAASRANDRYWVGTDSNWDDPLNWSDTPGGPGGATVAGGSDDVYLLQSSLPNPVIPLPSQPDAFSDLYVGASITLLQTDHYYSANYIGLGWDTPGSYQQLGGQLEVRGLTVGGGSASGAGTFVLAGGDLITRDQEIGNRSSSSLLRQAGGTNTTATLQVEYSNRYELADGQLSSHVLSLSGRFDQTGGDHAADYLFVNTSGQFHWSAGTLRVHQGFSIYGAFQFPDSPATLDVDGIVTLANPAGLSHSANVHLNLGPGAVLSHPADFDPAAAFASYSNAGVDHVLGTPLVIPAGTSVVSGGTIADPVDISGSLAGPGNSFDSLALYNHFTLRPGGTLGTAPAWDLDIVPGVGTSRILGGRLIASRIYTSLPWDNVTGAALLQQSAGSATLGSLSLGPSASYELSGGTLAVDGGTSLAGTYTAAPRAEFRQTGGSFTTGLLFLDDGRRDGSRFTIAAGSFTAQTVTVGGPVNQNTATFPSDTTFDIAGAGADVRIDTLSLARTARLIAVPGSSIHLATLSITSTDPRNFPGLGNLHLLFDAGPTKAGQLEVAGADRGPSAAGLADNFALASLEIGPPGGGGSLILVDAFDNQPSLSGPDALYVQDLILNPDTTLDLNGLRLYYARLTNYGGTIVPHGGGLLQLPEPAPVAVSLCLVPLAARRRRRRPASTFFVRS